MRIALGPKNEKGGAEKHPSKKGPTGSVAHFLFFSSILSLVDGVGVSTD
jgi:hypothetical protein